MMNARNSYSEVARPAFPELEQNPPHPPQYGNPIPAPSGSNISNPINYREDIELDDEALILIPIKKLNKQLKGKGISKQREKKIKLERRKLLNRGYAKEGRVKYEEEVTRLQTAIAEMHKQNELMPTMEELENQYRQLTRNNKIQALT